MAWIWAISRGNGWKPSKNSKLFRKHFVSGKRSLDPHYVSRVFSLSVASKKPRISTKTNGRLFCDNINVGSREETCESNEQHKQVERCPYKNNYCFTPKYKHRSHILFSLNFFFSFVPVFLLFPSCGGSVKDVAEKHHLLATTETVLSCYVYKKTTKFGKISVLGCTIV